MWSRVWELPWKIKLYRSSSGTVSTKLLRLLPKISSTGETNSNSFKSPKVTILASGLLAKIPST